MKRSIFLQIAFHKSGKPRKWLLAILFDSGGKARKVFRRVVHKKNGTIRPVFASCRLGVEPHLLVRQGDVEEVRIFLDRRRPASRAISTFPDPSKNLRINLVTDSIGPSSLFGGVGTALLLAVLWAEKANAKLRILTRTEPPSTTALSILLRAHNIEYNGDVDFHFAPHYGGRELPLHSRDLFLSTSWWNTRSLLNTVPAHRIAYLLQEDERMFYPMGDDHLDCSLTLAEPVGFVMINSRLLYDHLVSEADGIPGLQARSMYFEPAFSSAQRRWERTSERRNLFFYARPHNNDRNLFATGLRLIDEAAAKGLLHPGKWKVHLVGHDLPQLKFSGNLEAQYHKPMAWDQYIEFLRTMDAGVSLMYTPHPSYPPLDLAAMGIPVLTNSFASKTDLSHLSANIVTVKPDRCSLLTGLGNVLDRAENLGLCKANLASDRIQRNWRDALAPVIEHLDKTFRL